MYSPSGHFVLRFFISDFIRAFALDDPLVVAMLFLFSIPVVTAFIAFLVTEGLLSEATRRITESSVYQLVVGRAKALKGRVCPIVTFE